MNGVKLAIGVTPSGGFGDGFFSNPLLIESFYPFGKIRLNIVGISEQQVDAASASIKHDPISPMS